MSAAPARLLVEPRHEGLRADVYLALRLPGLSRARIRQKVQTGESLLNGRRYATSARLHEGDEITITWKGRLHEEPAPPLPVLHEDQWLLALDKPAGVASHPMGRVQSGTAIQFVRERDAEEIASRLARGDADWYPRLVHRLDALTSGVLLVARTRASFLAMQREVMERRLEKTYLAVVEGTIGAEQGVIDRPIGRDAASTVGVKMAVRDDGLAALTRFDVVRRMSGRTLLRAFPLTGRQHQVRLHLASIGHPVVGDLLYGDERLFVRWQERLAAGLPPDPGLPSRHMLHAEAVAFTHPFTGERLRIESPLPADFPPPTGETG
jgi:23S rRNA pseudouridine1911/1915/1917 synthase